ncbi:GTP cyclohydrolase 1 [Tenacibaculum sp. 190524A02b]|uniref:GTP cyclohydrolase I FolE n=1 Tax=Tenacibaculum vairaonense TaxID=3137860 RepID=UPI0032B129B9
MPNDTKDFIGDNHISTNTDTPLRTDAFAKSEDEKIASIQGYFSKIMEELGLDLSDDSLSGTPYRVAKMYVKELFYGLNPKYKPKLTTFENKYGYQKILIEQNITIDSSCEHHFLPIIGQAHIGYIPSKRVVGLSKINRLVDYYAHRPQVQERLCQQIHKDLKEALATEDIIIMIQAKHLCVSSRGIKDKSSYTTTLEYGGVFNNEVYRNEFFRLIQPNNNPSV